MKAILEYVYKMIVLAVYMLMVVMGFHFLCSLFTPLQPVGMYMDMNWLLPKLLQEIQCLGAISDLFLNIAEATSLLGLFTGVDVIKEIFYALLVAVFFKLGTGLYGGLSALTGRIFGSSRYSKYIDGLCTFGLILISIIVSAIAMDTLFYHLPETSYEVLSLIVAAVLAGLCVVAHYSKILLGVEKSKGIIAVVWDMVLQIFGVLLVYSMVACYEGLISAQANIWSYLLLVGLLILGIGACTAVFVYRMYQLGKYIR